MKEHRARQRHFNEQGNALCGEGRGMRQLILVPEFDLVTCFHCRRKLSDMLFANRMKFFKMNETVRVFVEENKLSDEHVKDMMCFMGNIKRERIEEIWNYLSVMLFNEADFEHIMKAQNFSIFDSITRKISRMAFIGIISRALASPTVCSDRVTMISYLKQFPHFKYERLKKCQN